MFHGNIVLCNAFHRQEGDFQILSGNNRGRDHRKLCIMHCRTRGQGVDLSTSNPFTPDAADSCAEPIDSADPTEKINLNGNNGRPILRRIILLGSPVLHFHLGCPRGLHGRIDRISVRSGSCTEGHLRRSRACARDCDRGTKFSRLNLRTPVGYPDVRLACSKRILRQCHCQRFRRFRE